MSSSFTVSESQTFTISHARHLACKVATDLKRIQRFYGSPDDTQINFYEAELISLLKEGYLDNVTYGYQRSGNWIAPTLQYTSKDLVGMIGSDDDPGRILPNADVQGAAFTSYLVYNSAWYKLTQIQRDNFERALTFQRTGAPQPGVNGYLSKDKTYSAGGQSLDRLTLKTY